MARDHATLPAVCILALLITGSPALAGEPRCGLALSASGTPKASDALVVLKSAVGGRSCEDCVCDTDRNGKLVASDALLTLRFAVGQPVELRCVACPVEKTIGVAGGEIVSSDGILKITFPPGALGTNTAITLAGLAPSKRGAATEDYPISDVFTLEPAGLELNADATIEYEVPVSDLPSGPRQFPLMTILQTSGSVALASPRGIPVEYVRISSFSGQSFFYTSDNSMKIGGHILKVEPLEFYAHAIADIFVPEEVSTDSVSTVDVHVEPKFVEPEAQLYDFSSRYRDPVASGYVPVGGAPYTSSFFDYLPNTEIRTHIKYTCDMSGTWSWSGLFETEVDTPDTIQTDSADIESEVECSPPLNLDTHRFAWSCIGYDDELAYLDEGPKIVCPTVDNQGSGFDVYAPEVDPEDEPFAFSLSAQYTLGAGAQYKLAVMKAPFESEHDAIFEAGEGYRFYRYTGPGDVWSSIGSDSMVGRYWSDIAPTVLPGAKPTVLMTDATNREFYRADYDGSAGMVSPVKILDEAALGAMQANGNLISGKLLTPEGPLIGVTGPVGQTPGKIFVHDLLKPEAAGTVLGPAGNDPECIHCDETLCFVTNSGDSSMTLIKWGHEKDPPSILGNVPIGLFPNSGHVRWLGGTRHVILTTGRADNTVSVTIIDTAAPNPVEFQTEMETPEDCDTPAFIDFLDEFYSVVVTCQTPGSLGVIRGVVLH